MRQHLVNVRNFYRVLNTIFIKKSSTISLIMKTSNFVRFQFCDFELCYILCQLSNVSDSGLFNRLYCPEQRFALVFSCLFTLLEAFVHDLKGDF